MLLQDQENRAIFARLNVPSVVGAGLASAVFLNEADKSASYPYVVFAFTSGFPVDYSFGPTPVMESGLWTVKVVTDLKGARPDSIPTRALKILEACDEALNAGLQLATGKNLWCRRFANLPPYKELVGNETLWHYAYAMRLVSRPQN